MIAFIEGKVVDKNPSYLLLLRQGMGYRLNYDPLYASRMPSLGEEARLYTYLYVREDELSLYAFPTAEEKQLFELIITVSGIGAKLGGSIVASLSPAEFALAILNNDLARLTQIKGVGKKTAQRMVLDLKDKISKDQSWSSDEGLAVALQAGSGGASSLTSEALAALQLLGYSQQEANRAVSLALQEAGEEPSLDELIRLALKLMAKV
ncbi:MAG: Holliday junction branch migration protein RuvA [Eubacteriales bacterium]|nr:Holliday junction branch migration protein RuvA [Eubacteriales bacterium]